MGEIVKARKEYRNQRFVYGMKKRRKDLITLALDRILHIQTAEKLKKAHEQYV
ncbi:MAG: hypothetical protein LBU37_09140 [Tannerellaceae bacterium]|jgi:hypothetical protein|nr:hypothetical protein [Tannerellaceae bacterium]